MRPAKRFAQGPGLGGTPGIILSSDEVRVYCASADDGLKESAGDATIFHKKTVAESPGRRKERINNF
jgi:hypothetical protein